MGYGMKNYRDFALSNYQNCANMESFKDFHRDCPEAVRTSTDLMYLPTYPRYSDKQIQKNISTIRKFFNKS